MAEGKRTRTAQGPRSSTAANARSLTVARRGIRTSQDFKNYMSGLMSDLIEGKVAPQVGNAACNAGGKLLKVVEMEYKYGRPIGRQGNRALSLAQTGPA